MPVDIHVTVEAGDWPDQAALEALAARAVAAATDEIGAGIIPPDAELGISFTDDAHMRRLNAEWRSKDTPTNVLSFPSLPVRRGAILPALLGDIVLAAETVSAEAAEEAKPLDHHIAHLLVHGFLHLAGYDHESDEDAENMEAAERRALATLAIPDPYA